MARRLATVQARMAKRRYRAESYSSEGSPDFPDDVGEEVLAPVVAEADVAEAENVVDGSRGEPFDLVQVVEREPST